MTGLRGLALLRRWPYGDFSVAPGSPDDTAEYVDIEQVGVRPGYDLWAATYDNLPNPLLAAEEPAMTRLLQRFAVGRALDAASGTGRFAAVLAARGHDVVALDSSRAMIEHARLRGLPFLMGDLRALPIEDQSFDLVVCALALTHFEDLEAPLTELARVTREGGHVVLSDIHPFAVALAARRSSEARRVAGWWCATTSTGTRTTLTPSEHPV